MPRLPVWSVRERSSFGHEFGVFGVSHGSSVVPRHNVVNGMWDIYFWVSDADAMYEELSGRGATIDYEPENQPYGCREFGIRDLDGYRIAFGQDLGPGED